MMILEKSSPEESGSESDNDFQPHGNNNLQQSLDTKDLQYQYFYYQQFF